MRSLLNRWTWRCLIAMTQLLILASCRGYRLQSGLSDAGDQNVNRAFVDQCRAPSVGASNLGPALRLTGDKPPPIGEQARQVFETNCSSCHSSDVAGELSHAQLPDILDWTMVNQAGKLEALVFQVENGQMPPGQRESAQVSASEIEILRQWRKAGFPSWQGRRPVNQLGTISPLDVRKCVDRAHQDELKGDSEQPSFLRYVSFAHLFNAGDNGTGVSRNELDQLGHALNELLNHLSTNRAIRRAQAIDPLGSVFRIDIRDYGWQKGGGLVFTNDKWVAIEQLYQSLALPTERYGFSQSAYDQYAPERILIVRGDWLIGAASQGRLYYDVLGIPDNVLDLEKALRVDVSENLKMGLAKRFGFRKSLVSEHNRLIERHPTPFGSYWKSYDFAASSGRQSLLNRPLGPNGLNVWNELRISEELKFQHDGGEMIFSLPNGLHGYALTDSNDKLLFATQKNIFGDAASVGPTQIVKDSLRKSLTPRGDNEVVNAYSCRGCHYKGMRWETSVVNGIDVARYHALLSSYPQEVRQAIARIYVDPSDPRVQAETFGRDEDQYLAAYRQAVGVEPETRPMFWAALRMESEMSLLEMAAELGIPAQKLVDFSRNVERSGTLRDFRATIWQSISRPGSDGFEFDPAAGARKIIRRNEFYESMPRLISILWSATPGPVSELGVDRPVDLPRYQHDASDTRFGRGVASITVELPEDALLFVNGEQTFSTGGVRVLSSDGLQPGYKYAYKLEVYYKGVKEPSRTTISVRPGTHHRVKFNGP